MNQRFTLIVAGSPDQRTGGYLYDAHIVAELRKQGWDIELIGLDGHFPDADSVAQQALESALVQLPDDHQVVIDGLVMGGLPEVIKRHQSRLAITALVHHPLGDERGLSDDEQARFHRLELGGVGYLVGERLAAEAVHRLQDRPQDVPGGDDRVTGSGLLVGFEDETQQHSELVDVFHDTRRTANELLLLASLDSSVSAPSRETDIEALGGLLEDVLRTFNYDISTLSPSPFPELVEKL